MNITPYEALDERFTAPEAISPFYGTPKRIPRKLKKLVKAHCGCHWEGLSNGGRLWYYLSVSNPDYKRFIIKRVCEG